MTELKKPFRGLTGVGALLLLVLLVLTKTKFTRGLMGIGALILFIAVVLIAALAATVMLTSGSSLQSKALITGSETRESISPALDTVSVRGADPTTGGTPHAISRLYILARLPAGGETVSLNTTIIKLDTTLGAQNHIFGGTVANGVSATGTSSYVVTYIQSGVYQEDDYVNRGDMVNLKFNIDGQLGENMKGRITIIPYKGNINQLEFVTPEYMSDPMIIVWPTT